MIKFLYAIVSLLNNISDNIDNYKRKKEEKDYDEKRKQNEQDPADFFKNHFDSNDSTDNSMHDNNKSKDDKTL